MLSEPSVATPRAARASSFCYVRPHEPVSALASGYARAPPFPHVTLPGFFMEGVAERLSAECPSPKDGPWVQYAHYNERKAGLTDSAAFSPLTRRVIDELNSTTFVRWLSALTGIRDLVADPSLEGGGLHQCGAGGFLNIHADFTKHHDKQGWTRRVNVIVYLSQGWKAEWGGAIEFWDRRMRECVVRIPPVSNHAVIFNTDEHSYHGFPDPIACPAGVMRRSLALDYYTADAGYAPSLAPHPTNYQARPQDGMWKAALIWADKQLVRLYSIVKSRWGMSDELASRSLGWIARWKRRSP